MKKLIMLVVLLLSIIGCSATVGPVIRNVEVGKNNELILYECDIDVSSFGTNFVSAEFMNCRKRIAKRYKYKSKVKKKTIK